MLCLCVSARVPCEYDVYYVYFTILLVTFLRGCNVHGVCCCCCVYFVFFSSFNRFTIRLFLYKIIHIFDVALSPSLAPSFVVIYLMEFRFSANVAYMRIK